MINDDMRISAEPYFATYSNQSLRWWREAVRDHYDIGACVYFSTSNYLSDGNKFDKKKLQKKVLEARKYLNLAKWEMLVVSTNTISSDSLKPLICQGVAQSLYDFGVKHYGSKFTDDFSTLNSFIRASDYSGFDVGEEQVGIFQYDRKNQVLYLPSIMQFFEYRNESWINDATKSKAILDDVYKQLEAWLKELKIKLPKPSEKELIEHAITKMVKKATDEFLSQTKDQKLSLEKDIIAYSRALNERQGSYQKLLSQMSIYVSSVEPRRKKILSEIQKIKKLKFVKKVSVKNEGIFIEIGAVSCKGVYINDFTLVFNSDGGIGARAKDKKRVLENTLHPHIMGEHICYGEKQDKAISDMIINSDLCNVIILTYRTLKLYNPHSAYLRLAYWMEVANELDKTKHEFLKDDIDSLALNDEQYLKSFKQRVRSMAVQKWN